MATFPAVPQPLGTIFGGDGPVSRHTSGTVYKGRAVKLHTTSNTITAIANAGVAMHGICLEDKATALDVGVLLSGQYAEAEAGDALASLHTNLALDNVGRFVAATTNDIIVGVNLSTAAQAGDQFVILISTAQKVSA